MKKVRLKRKRKVDPQGQKVISGVGGRRAGKGMRQRWHSMAAHSWRQHGGATQVHGAAVPAEGAHKHTTLPK